MCYGKVVQTVENLKTWTLEGLHKMEGKIKKKMIKRLQFLSLRLLEDGS